MSLEIMEPVATLSKSEAPRMSRRAFAAGTAVSLMLAACHAPDPSSANSVMDLDASAPEDPAFFALSKIVTGHFDLDPLIAARTSQAFHQLFPEMAGRFGALSALATKNPDPQKLLDAAQAIGQGETLLAIVAAWYTGTVGTGLTAKAMAYADALMNRPVADGLFPPTYQLGGPAWWTAAPPAVDAPTAPAQLAGHDHK